MRLQAVGPDLRFKFGVIETSKSSITNSLVVESAPESAQPLEEEVVLFDVQLVDINEYPAIRLTRNNGLIFLISIEDIGRAEDLSYFIGITQGSCRNFAIIIPPLYEDYLQLSSFFGEWIGKIAQEVASVQNLVIVIPSEEVDSYYSWLPTVQELSPKISIGLIFEREMSVTSNYINYYNISLVILRDGVFSGQEVSPLFHQILNKKNPPVIIIDNGDVDAKLHKLKLMFAKQKWNYFLDVFIEPLQPLRDDLELGVYEVFERDKRKYELYNRAIKKAVLDLTKLMKNKPLNALIVGPGRGPLIDMVVRAFESIPNKLITAIEKNKNCYDTLRQKNQDSWNNQVKLIEDDVRFVKDTLNYDGYDLVVSELLGSFGCNELCPEILQNFNYQRGNKTVMIPQLYHSHAVPIYSDALNNLPGAAKRPYLCMLDKYYKLTKPTIVFTFKHPNRESNFEKSFTYKCEHNTFSDLKVNGLQGYFTAELGDEIVIGNNPEMVENCCESWYPMIFPIETVNWCDMIEYFIYRRSDKEGVWYEWGIVTAEKTLTYNKDGIHYKIQL